jgi:hypothetical protein
MFSVNSMSFFIQIYSEISAFESTTFYYPLQIRLKYMVNDMLHNNIRSNPFTPRSSHVHVLKYRLFLALGMHFFSRHEHVFPRATSNFH